jgi:hypothetical protein
MSEVRVESWTALQEQLLAESWRPDLAGYDRAGVVWAVDHAGVHEQLPDVLRDALDHEGAGAKA